MNLLFVHGFMGSALNWSTVRSKVEALANESGIPLKTHAVDLLGHSSRRSSKPLSSFTSAHAALYEELLQDIESMGPIVAVGHSFGLRPLLLISQKRPELIPFLIVEDASPELSLQSCSFLNKILKTTPTPFRTRESAREYFDTKYTKQLARFLLSNIRSLKDPEIHDWRFDRPFLEALLLEAESNPLWQEWHQYSGESFLITGEKSTLFADPSVLQTMIEKRLPRRLPHYEIKNSGHWIHSDQQDDFCRVLIQIIISINELP
jgi:pimeloyl-ACP methyl ester carboxylesterase